MDLSASLIHISALDNVQSIVLSYSTFIPVLHEYLDSPLHDVVHGRYSGYQQYRDDDDVNQLDNAPNI